MTDTATRDILWAPHVQALIKNIAEVKELRAVATVSALRLHRSEQDMEREIARQLAMELAYPIAEQMARKNIRFQSRTTGVGDRVYQADVALWHPHKLDEANQILARLQSMFPRVEEI